MRTPFTITDSGLGHISLVSFNLDLYAQDVFRWVTEPYAEFWGMQGYSVEQVCVFYKDILQNDHCNAFIGLVNGTPSFLVETYDPNYDQVGQHYNVQSGDMGMHILIAPTTKPKSGFTSNVFKAVMEFMFQDPMLMRVVVEPDHRNYKIHRLNKMVGFQHIKRIQIGEKLANLAFCTREQFHTASTLEYEKKNMDIHHDPEMAITSIDPKSWTKVNRQHVRKCLAELCHERILTPKKIDHAGEWGIYQLQTDDGEIKYIFKAKLLKLDHWLIETSSIIKMFGDQEKSLDSISFVIEFSQTLNIPKKLLPTYLEEITSTLYSAAFKEKKDWLSAEALLNADFQQVESAMIEGHPAFIANNGRIGFDAQDFLRYVPEAGYPISLIWIAAHKSRADFSHGQDINYDDLMMQELDLSTQDEFAKKIVSKQKNPDDYTLIPVHPWQWYNKLANVFAPDIASGHLICLGYGDDSYQAQQSIRTFFNRSNPNKFYVKTALSVLNMGFMRGLSANYMRSTPAINDWVYQLIQGDKYLQKNGFKILREIAATGYRNPYYEHEALQDNPYKKMLAALWRESPVPLLGPGQRLMTMASLLHVDPNNKALLPTLIKASELSTEDWLSKYMDIYLSPLLHCYYQHSLVFMPHGENLILIFENNVPVKAIMKDIGEEVYLLNSNTELPDSVQRISIQVPPEEETLCFYTDVFDCFFRYMSAILVEHIGFPEQNFWKVVADNIHRYQTEHPELREKFEQHSLFSPEFVHSCLNRLQLANNQQMVDLTDPAGSLKFAGTLINPISQFA
ncbi:GNAT family N-acetyltransferase [Vibrio tetraodonis]|uniref:GNAT family N-acetyltransferase n=1 Tax=Vibrio tetraodonis TaxID=2231647 RepID=UPI000E09EC3B|nr:GNAT family N-acetyltransferase [Vibrio tetraodonis]